MKNVGGWCGSASPPGLAIVKNSISLPKHGNVTAPWEREFKINRTISRETRRRWMIGWLQHFRPLSSEETDAELLTRAIQEQKWKINQTVWTRRPNQSQASGTPVSRRWSYYPQTERKLGRVTPAQEWSTVPAAQSGRSMKTATDQIRHWWNNLFNTGWRWWNENPHLTPLPAKENTIKVWGVWPQRHFFTPDSPIQEGTHRHWKAQPEACNLNKMT